MMRWTGWTGLAAGLLALAGCGYGLRMAPPASHYSTDTRPDPSYFCYDCHGYRYFDPYYDYCEGYDFRYRWTRHPRALAVYRERYVRIKESHPDYGRYRYREGYRAVPRYQEPRDYDAWRGRGDEKPAPEVSREPRGKGHEKQKEKDRGDSGRKKGRKGDERRGPRDAESRPTLRGGRS